MIKEPCPKCRENGRDSSGDNLVRYPDGGGHCFSCGYHENASGAKLERGKSKLTLGMVESYPVGTLLSRGLPEDIASFFDTRVSYNPSTSEIDTVYYPYYSGTTLRGYKVRKEPKSFSVVGETTGFFGKHCCAGTPVLIITEGEEDTLAAKALLNEKPAKPYDVVSLPDGASGLSKIKEESEFLMKYNKVFLCLDSDEPGQEAQTKLADWISTLTDTYTVTLDPEIGKDASDYWQKKAVTEFREAFRKAKKYEPEDVVNGTEISLDSLLEPLEEGYRIPFPGMQDKLHGLRKSEIVTLCAGSGIGKSTLARELAKSLIEQGCSVANVALENQMIEAAQALVALDMNIPLNKFRFSPPPKSEVQTSYEKMIANGKTYFYKHFGRLTSDRFIDKMYYYARSKRCDFIILDHLSMVISSSDSQNERKDIDSIMTKLAQLVVETGVGIIQVVHLKRPSKDKSFAKGGEVELSDLRGSAALEQLSWAVVGLERDQQGDDADFSRVRILKNRTFGFTGLCDTLKYNPTTGRLEPFVLKEEE